MDGKKRRDPAREFGDRVREVRHSRGMTQEELADASDLDRSYIGSVERGERNISLVNVVKIAKALGTSASELLKGVGGK